MHDGEPLQLGGPKQLGLLALLHLRFTTSYERTVGELREALGARLEELRDAGRALAVEEAIAAAEELAAT